MEMTNQILIDCIADFVLNSPENRVSRDDAIYPELAGLKIYDAPLTGFASADDELFTASFKKEGVIHPEYMAPGEWLPGAKTVISFFLPYTEHVRESNRCMKDLPYSPELTQSCSAQWLHARIEGQIFLDRLTDHIQTFLENRGFKSLCPATSGKLRMISPYISSWSERHAAYAAGLGTFGLSKGLITAKGMAGRFGSVITDAHFCPTPRPYSNPFEYCTMCGACVVKCPVGAIDKSKGCALGKDQAICASYVNDNRLPPHGPGKRVRYGCGKCQCGVPCESAIPAKTNM